MALIARPLLLLLLLLAGLGGCSGEPPPEDEALLPEGIIQELKSGTSITTDVNARSPAFARSDSRGRTIRTQDFIGNNAVLLDFWSVFCQSCIEEMPFLMSLHERFVGEGLQVVSVNTDFFPQARIERFMEKAGIKLPFPLLLDRDQSLSGLFQVDALPVVILIDSAGWIRMVHLGYRPADHDLIEKRVRQACRGIRDTVVTLQPVDGQTAFAPPQGEGRGRLGAGDQVPGFDLADAEGRISPFASLRGGAPSLVFFWSLFCQPCREELPFLVGLTAKHSSRGLRSFGVNVDSARLRQPAGAFFRKNGGEVLSYFDAPGDDGGVTAARAFGVTTTPSLFLLDEGGKVVFSASGEVSPPELDAEVEDLLSRLPASSPPGARP